MSEEVIGVSHVGQQEVVLVAPLCAGDRTLVDRVVFGATPAHQIEGDAWATTLLRRIAEDVMPRDYLCTFAHNEEGARRVLGIALGLARMANREGAAGAAAFSVAGWCALALARWELADALALQALKADGSYSLAAQVRQAVAHRWFAELLQVEPDVDERLVRQCSADVLRRITEPRACIQLDARG